MNNFLKNNRLVQLVLSLAVVFGGYVHSSEKKMTKEQLKKDLIAAEWSQEKIKQLREKTRSTREMKYDRIAQKEYYVTHNQPLSHLKDALDDLLIDHYAKKIYAALKGVPASERAAWADELHLILAIGLKDFYNRGKERYEVGQLSTINSVNDGSEIGIEGTKYQALARVKAATNNFITIPFNAYAQKMLPVVFFNSLSHGDKISAKPVNIYK
jgi:hypothetical protein